jgi:hypothetical protein
MAIDRKCKRLLFISKFKLETFKQPASLPDTKETA